MDDEIMYYQEYDPAGGIADIPYIREENGDKAEKIADQRGWSLYDPDDGTGDFIVAPKGSQVFGKEV